MIKTIIFDNNGVLTTGDKEEGTLDNVSRFLGLKKSDIEEIWDEEAKEVDFGAVDNRKFLENVLDKLGVKNDTDVEKLLEVYLESYKAKPDVQEYAKKLRKKYELTMITNFGTAFDGLYKGWGIDKIFDPEKIFVSSKLHMIKPNEDIFLYVLEKIGRKPEETVFIDDNKTNVETATRLGMKGILFKNLAQLQKDLENVLEYEYV